MMLMPGEMARRVERLLGSPMVSARRVERGYTPAARWVVQLRDGSSAFVKAATTNDTAEWLRSEYRVYAQVNADYLPRMLGWDDDGDRPILALEDLSGAYWPPPWELERIEGVLETLAQVRATPPPEGLPVLTPTFFRRPGVSLASWGDVGANPDPFLAVGLCSAAWLQDALPALLEAEKRAAVEGDELLHLDVRSDNLCFDGSRVVLVDWNWACVGNGLLDVAAWLPSLHAEGGPQPEKILPNAPQFAALLSGFFAARAGLPIIPDAPRVREVQLQQLRSALPWAVRALGLPPLDGAQ